MKLARRFLKKLKTIVLHCNSRCESTLPKLVQKRLECALEKHSDFSAEARKIIVELNKICLNNVVTQCGDHLYIHKNES